MSLNKHGYPRTEDFDRASEARLSQNTSEVITAFICCQVLNTVAHL